MLTLINYMLVFLIEIMSILLDFKTIQYFKENNYKILR